MVSRVIHKFASIKFAGADLPARTIIAIASDDTPDRAVDIVVASGVDASAYRHNPVCLRDHDPTKPIGTASVTVNLWPGENSHLSLSASEAVSTSGEKTYWRIRWLPVAISTVTVMPGLSSVRSPSIIM
jgi:hypothetical protein